MGLLFLQGTIRCPRVDWDPARAVDVFDNTGNPDPPGRLAGGQWRYPLRGPGRNSRAGSHRGPKAEASTLRRHNAYPHRLAVTGSPTDVVT